MYTGVTDIYMRYSLKNKNKQTVGSNKYEPRVAYRIMIIVIEHARAHNAVQCK